MQGLLIMGMVFLVTVIILVMLFLLFWRYYFLRDPERIIPLGNIIVSPADGKIIKIVRIENLNNIDVEKNLFGKIRTLTRDTVKKGYLISIFMSPFDVHVNRAPINGEIIYQQHTPGKFRNAKTLRAIENEKNEIIIENKTIGKVKVIQIAGFLARRIVSFVDQGETLKKGQKIGLINLGSQVTVIIPDINLQVTEGQRVIAGETILAKY
jgi:phosphatidylserine decarboxylase